MLVVIAVVALWLVSGFYRVQPEEQGVVLTFGRFTQTTVPGLHWYWPSPIGSIYKPKVTRVNRVQVGFVTETRRQGGAASRDIPQESLMLTGDENIIDVQSVVFWVINDPKLFLFNIRPPGADGERRLGKPRCARSLARRGSSSPAPRAASPSRPRPRRWSSPSSTTTAPASR